MGSFSKFSIKAGLMVLSFVAGYSYHLYLTRDERYSVERKNGESYLYDHQRDHGLPIHEKEFQVGSLEYRLEGILRDRSLPTVLNKLMVVEDE